jgi:hypothetical protein
VSGWRGRATGLMDRVSECDGLDRLIEAVRASEGRALVVRDMPAQEIGPDALHFLERTGLSCRH